MLLSLLLLRNGFSGLQRYVYDNVFIVLVSSCASSGRARSWFPSSQCLRRKRVLWHTRPSQSQFLQAWMRVVCSGLLSLLVLLSFGCVRTSDLTALLTAPLTAPVTCAVQAGIGRSPSSLQLMVGPGCVPCGCCSAADACVSRVQWRCRGWSKRDEFSRRTAPRRRSSCALPAACRSSCPLPKKAVSSRCRVWMCDGGPRRGCRGVHDACGCSHADIFAKLRIADPVFVAVKALLWVNQATNVAGRVMKFGELTSLYNAAKCVPINDKYVRCALGAVLFFCRARDATELRGMCRRVLVRMEKLMGAHVDWEIRVIKALNAKGKVKVTPYRKLLQDGLSIPVDKGDLDGCLEAVRHAPSQHVSAAASASLVVTCVAGDHRRRQAVVRVQGAQPRFYGRL